MSLDLTWDLSLEWSTITSITLPILIGVVYFYRVGQLRERGRQPKLWRQASFTVGLAAIVLVTVGPMDDLADNFVFGHMIQHTILLEEVSLLLVFGLTGPVLGPILTKPGLRRLRGLTYPTIAFGIWALVMFGWHAPPAYQLAAENEVVHLCEHASFVGAGVLMWLALLGPFPKPDWFGSGPRAVYAAGVHFSSMVLANVLMWSGTVFYSFYEASDHAHGISPITDQSLAGVVLMIQSATTMFAILAWLVLRWARQDTERQELVDLAIERGIDLDERRAGRAVAAGRAAELRTRLLDQS
jgi:cytochrome c oxidase assembly factor CtaG